MAHDLSARDEGTSRDRHRLVIGCAAAAVLLLYLVAGCLGVRQLRRYAAEAVRLRQSRIEAALNASDGPRPVAGLGPAGEARPVEVKVALSVTRVGEIALKDSSWTADFDVSFRWRGDAVT